MKTVDGLGRYLKMLRAGAKHYGPNTSSHSHVGALDAWTIQKQGKHGKPVGWNDREGPEKRSEMKFETVLVLTLLAEGDWP